MLWDTRFNCCGPPAAEEVNKGCCSHGRNKWVSSWSPGVWEALEVRRTLGPFGFPKAIIYTYLINCSFVKTYEELMALCKRQREKVERSKRMKNIIFEPLCARHWAGSFAYISIYHNLNMQNELIRQFIILIL